MSAAAQLLLPIKLPGAVTFQSFVAGENGEPLARLRDLASGNAGARMVYLCGPPGSGKTHLLYATCQAVNDDGRLAAYVPVDSVGVTPDLLDSLEDRALICIDDLDSVAGQRAWENAVVGLYERAGLTGSALIVAGHSVPAASGFSLPDLVSRLSGQFLYRLVPPGDAEIRTALQLRAAQRGFALSEEVVDYMLRRFPRDGHSLFALLDRLDALSLAERRRVTVPLLRRLENAGRDGAGEPPSRIQD